MGGSVEAWRASLISSRERSAFSLLIAFHAISPTAFSWWELLWSLLLLSADCQTLFSTIKPTPLQTTTGLPSWYKLYLKRSEGGRRPTERSVFNPTNRIIRIENVIKNESLYFWQFSSEWSRKPVLLLSHCSLKNYDSKQMCNSRKINRHAKAQL